jgi:3'(2'), 5'-bisphosphate nucleotidase
MLASLDTPWASRLTAAITATRGAGVALMDLRGSIVGIESLGGQLKTSADLAAEGWVLGYLDGQFPGELVLAEERFDRTGVAWAGAHDYWTVDALDGTRSFVEGFDGFCVQVAYVSGGTPRVGVIYEPVTRSVYFAAEGVGAWKNDERLGVASATSLERGFRYVDSTRPRDRMGDVVTRFDAQLVECGSVGLKICRVAEGRADVYAKRFNYKLWDVAPGDVLLREAGGALSAWTGASIDFGGARSHFDTLLAAPKHLVASIVAELEA